MTFTIGAGEVLDRLATDLDGRLVRPGDDAWDAARQAWNLAVDQRPAAVVVARSARDVQSTVVAARELGYRVAPQATGHNAGPLGELAGTILLKTSGMREVTVDPAARIASVGAGAEWQDVTTAAAPHGLAALAGSAPDVGVAGYTLGGGLSWLGRSHGLAANSVVALEVVTADGALRRVDAGHDPELFWALRGGGGSYAIVTRLEFRLFPIADVYAGVLFFPAERAAEVLQAWRGWLPSVPDSVSSVGRLLNFPPLPDLPPHLAGRSFAVVEVVCQLPDAEAEALLAPLRALGPAMDTVERIPAVALAHLHMDPPTPVPGSGDGMSLRALPAEAVEAAVRVARANPQLLSLELRHLGGALAIAPADGGAVSTIEGQFALFAVGMAPDARALEAVEQAVEAVKYAMAPWSTGGCYLNFSERHRAPEAYFGASYARLRAVKRAYDPEDLIRANHPVAPAE